MSINALLEHDNYQAAKTLLDVATVRQKAISSNIANVDTPGWKRVDVSPSFSRELKKVLRDKESLPSDFSKLKVKLEHDNETPAVKPDGNNISMDKELLKMNENALEYEFLTQYMSNSIKQLKTAITGKAGF